MSEFVLTMNETPGQTLTSQDDALEYIRTERARIMARIEQAEVIGHVARLLKLRLAEKAIAKGESYDLTTRPVSNEDAVLFLMGERK